MITRKSFFAAAAALVLGCTASVSVGAAVAAPAEAAASGSVVSRVGVPWTAEDATSGSAVLTYGNAGCEAVDADGFCTSGQWPTIPGAHWIWRSQNVTPEEDASGTPVVTFTDTFQIDQAGGRTTLRVSADDYYTVTLNGETIGSGSLSSIDTYRLAPVVGLNTITVAASSSSGPAGVTYRVDTTWKSALTLTASAAQVTYGRSTVLNASLTSASTNRTVSVFAQPVGGKKVLLTKDEVNAAGSLDIRVTPRATTTYTASYTGGDGWSAASSKPVKVAVAGRWAARSLGGYDTVGRYRLYHYRTSCRPPEYNGCPTERFTLAPGHPRERVTMTFQYWAKGRWSTYSTHRWLLSKRSVMTVFTWYDSRGIIGTRIRVGATFNGDGSHASAASPWVYWRVTR